MEIDQEFLRKNKSPEDIKKAFEFLPLLVEALKEVEEAGTVEDGEQKLDESKRTRLGDISEASLKLKQKYEQAIQLLESLPGVDMDIHTQQDTIKKTKALLHKKRSLVTHYHEALFQGRLPKEGE